MKPLPNIDQIIVINLCKRVDRWTEICHEFNRLEIPLDQVTRLEGFETPEFGTLGCTISHAYAIQSAYNKKYNYTLILEDDFNFRAKTREELDKQLEAVWTSKFDVFHFGQNPIKISDEVYDFNNMKIRRSIDTQTASGYLVRYGYLPEIKKVLTSSIGPLQVTGQHWIYACDQIWKSLQQCDKWFYLEPSLGYQRESFSDNSQSVANYEL